MPMVENPTLNRVSRRLGLTAADTILGRFAYQVGASTYTLVTGDMSAKNRQQINVLKALPQVWFGLQRYEQAYLTPRAPFRSVDMRVLIEHYDYFFIDIMGTYKDERKELWPQAVAVLQAINAMGKRFVIVSNTTDILPEHTHEQLTRAGVQVDLEQIVSAGMTLGPIFSQHGLLGERVLSIGTEASKTYIRRAGAEPIDPQPGKNGYKGVVLSFLRDPLDPEVERDLIRAAAKGVPIILANADKVIPLHIGFRENKAYRLAKRIEEETGRKVILAGKPGLAIYELGRERMGLDSERELRGLAFGDTVWTDTQGANLFQLAHPELQIDNVLLLSGVERRVNNVPAQLAAYIKDKPVYCPTYLLFAFAFPG